MTDQGSIEERQVQAFGHYIELRRKAEASGDLEDALEAGKAWGRFADRFVSGPVPSVALVRIKS